MKRAKSKRGTPATQEQRNGLGGDLFRDPNKPIFGGRRDPDLNAKISALPFVRKRKRGDQLGGRHFWSVTESADYQRDYDQGRKWARLVLPFFKFNVGPPLLSWIVSDMIAGGEQSGRALVLGFVRELGDQLATGQWLLQKLEAAGRRKARKQSEKSRGLTSRAAAHAAH